MEAKKYYGIERRILFDYFYGEDRQEVENFFMDNGHLEYNEFLELLHEEYGYVLENARKNRTYKYISNISTAATIYIVSFFIGVTVGILWVAAIYNII